MTLLEALNITGIRENEINGIDKDAMLSVIKEVELEHDIFPYDGRIKTKLDAWKTIYDEVK